MDENARLERNKYQRNWRKFNPDKVKKNNENYWIRRSKAGDKNENKGL